MCRQGSFPWLRSGYLICSLQQSSAFAGSFYHWFVWGKQSFSFTLLDKHQLSSPRAYLISYLKAVNYVGVGREFLARVIGIEAVGLDGPRKKWWSRWLGMEPRVAIILERANRREINDGNWEGAARKARGNSSWGGVPEVKWRKCFGHRSDGRYQMQLTGHGRWRLRINYWVRCHKALWWPSDGGWRWSLSLERNRSESAGRELSKLGGDIEGSECGNSFKKSCWKGKEMNRQERESL